MVGVTAKVLAVLRAFVAQATEPMRYHALVRYRVVSVAGDGRLTLQIVSQATGFPDALPISAWPGAPGAKGEPAAGSIVLVSFIEGDPSLPIVTHFSPPGSAFFLPVSAALDASTLVRIGENAATTQLGSGSVTFTGANQADRVVRWGDIYVDPTSGPTALTPSPGSSISKVKA